MSRGDRRSIEARRWCCDDRTVVLLLYGRKYGRGALSGFEVRFAFCRARKWPKFDGRRAAPVKPLAGLGRSRESFEWTPISRGVTRGLLDRIADWCDRYLSLCACCPAAAGTLVSPLSAAGPTIGQIRTRERDPLRRSVTVHTRTLRSDAYNARDNENTRARLLPRRAWPALGRTRRLTFHHAVYCSARRPTRVKYTCCYCFFPLSPRSVFFYWLLCWRGRIHRKKINQTKLSIWYY